MGRRSPTWSAASALALLLLCLSACTVEVLRPGVGVDKAALPDAGVVEPPVLEPTDGVPTFRIDRVEPSEGELAGGIRIAVHGNLFEEGAAVWFGDVESDDVLFLGPDLLNVELPPGQPGLSDVTIQNPNGSVSTLKGGFRYLSPVVVEAVDPPSGPAWGGTPVTVTGSGFLPGSILLIGGRVALDAKRVDASSFVALTPGGMVGAADIHVVHEAGSGRLRDGFTYHTEPRIDRVHPPNGPLVGGGPVNVIGTGLLGVEAVTIGGKDAPILARWGDDTVTVTAPPGTPGAADVLATTPFAEAFLPQGYAYLDPIADESTLTLVSAVPQQGPAAGGTEVVLTAYGAPDAAGLDVRFGLKSADILAVDAASHTITVVAPKSPAGTVDIVATSPLGTSTLTDRFTYVPSLQVTSVSPDDGPAGGGTLVTLTGAGFIEGMSVRVGALLAKTVTVTGPDSATAITSPGSPGPADVRVELPGVSSTLSQAFEYKAETTAVLVAKPDQGAVAGGTFVRVFGTGFGGATEVRIGGTLATGIVVQDSTLITAFSPPGPIGPADVTITTGGITKTLTGAFTYFDPTSGYGGTWGDAVDEAVNITVLDAMTNEPVPGAFVVLSAKAETPYKGVTDENGEITFGGPGLLGRQVATASKVNYTTSSVVEFDASNITLQIAPYIPPASGGAPGTPLPDGSVSGRVTGLGKYVVVPPGSCSTSQTTGLTYCKPCIDAVDCGGGSDAACVNVGAQGTFCTTSCAEGQQCPEGYTCAASTGGGAVCLPVAGRKEARCETSLPGIFSGAPSPGEGSIVAGGGDTYAIASRLGEVAIVCRGGWVDYATEEFVPTVMGIRRHVFVNPGEDMPDQDVELTIPLDRTVELRLDDPPLALSGPNSLLTDAYLELGTDGVIPMGSSTGVSPEASYALQYFPLELSGELYDATYTFMAGAYTNGTGELPYSLVLARGITQIGDQGIVERTEGAWGVVPSGVEQDLRAVWGDGAGRVWAVGDRGGIYLRDETGWSQQPSPTKKDLLAVSGQSAWDAWAVGRQGAVLHWNGLQWTQEKSNTSKDLRAVAAAGGDVWAAGWFTLLHRGAAGWEKAEGAPQSDLFALWAGSPSDVWGVGSYGTAVHYDGQTWSAMQLPTERTLRAVWGTGTGLVFAAGDAGVVLRYDGAQWSALPEVPTTRPLHAIRGHFEDGALKLWMAGADGTILHHDGLAWIDESPPGTATNLNGLWTAPDGVALAVGTHSLLLGPFMRVPELITAPGAEPGTGASFELVVPPGTEPHFRYIVLSSAYGLPLWSIVAAGDVTAVSLPDLGALAGLSPLPKGPKSLQVYSVYKDGFDIDAYDAFDFGITDWNGWSVHAFPFE